MKLWIFLNALVLLALLEPFSRSDHFIIGNQWVLANAIIIDPSNPQYSVDRLDWNQRVPAKNPSALVYCENAQDVANWISYARNERARNESYQFSIRSGRHSYEAYSVNNGGIVIDVSRMKSISIDTMHQQVTIGAGMRNFEIYQSLWNHSSDLDGRFAFTGGTCPTVGIGGFALGGGFGYLARYHGLAIDNLVSAQIVMYNSQILTVNQTNEYRDLFWALRGGGNGNFGVVISFTFKLIKAPSFVVKYDLEWSNDDHMYHVFSIWQELAPTIDSRLTSQFTIYNGTFASQGLFVFGSEEELRDLLQPLLTASTNNLRKIQFKTYSYMDSVLEYAGCKTIQECEAIMHSQPSYEHPILYKTKSSYAFEPLSRHAIQQFANILSAPYSYAALAGSFSCVQFDSYGGVIGQVDIQSTAFPHRRARFHAQYMIYYNKREYTAMAEDWINAFYEKTAPLYLSRFSYANYCDSYLKHYEHSYYGENMWELRKVKQKYDPINLFRYEQSIQFP
ncbi:hypothetical protein C9374_010893 [Naegleria lovaniensis]|uniref:FAD-binding PCMH-type domain-containing protein n=1 Tax=Naegleria lovaniensis TaxID=51637 RepID=A0AA88GG86_NAELO|nr:uncharacterized protein C9374_010893 [Naegleria lovaniensis]KAG2374323.1 hypothetical protein C9374_010893 [Naegleria lovaniensis]